jgi:Tol biopolymer transport system component
MFSAARFIYTLMTITMGFSLLLGSQLAQAGGKDGRIVFSKLLGGKCQIVITDEYGNNIQNLSKSNTNDYEPSWSFDGRHIVFTSDRNGNGTLDVYIMDADGYNQRQITNNKVWEYSPCFSPDGKKLIFTRATNIIQVPNPPPPDFKIYTVDIDGSNERYLIDGYEAKWSPDGKKIVFCKDTNIIIMDTDCKSQVKIAGLSDYPSWSPDGKQLAFRSIDGEIYKIDSDGNNIVLLTKRIDNVKKIMNNAVNPSWSPDGRYIIFWDMETLNNMIISNIYKVSTDGGIPVLIISEGMYPSWFDPAFIAVNPAGKLADTWGGIKIR